MSRVRALDSPRHFKFFPSHPHTLNTRLPCAAQALAQNADEKYMHRLKLLSGPVRQVQAQSSPGPGHPELSATTSMFSVHHGSHIHGRIVRFQLITIKVQFLGHTSHTLSFQWTRVARETVSDKTAQPAVVSLGYAAE